MFSHCISVNKKKQNYIHHLLKNSGKHILIIFKLHFHCFFNFLLIILNWNGNKWLFAWNYVSPDGKKNVLCHFWGWKTLIFIIIIYFSYINQPYSHLNLEKEWECKDIMNKIFIFCIIFNQYIVSNYAKSVKKMYLKVIACSKSSIT